MTEAVEPVGVADGPVTASGVLSAPEVGPGDSDGSGRLLGFVEPCSGFVEYTEFKNRSGVLMLRAECACGQRLGTSRLEDLSRRVAIEDLSEWVACHRKGVTYSAFMGFRSDGVEMTDAEYVLVEARMSGLMEAEGSSAD